ncbi:MAG: 3-deoxy-7-phosphoheptulonate synthase [Clostridiales bacterium]|jgi:3-deoxy-7-phosphoheptulonate synthase|nr:3-deoxy-7-phosphoheptulonate synthase [Clostridiales bacterium]
MLSDKKSQDDFANISIGDTCEVSPKTFVMMAGPCAAESRDQVMRTADALAEIGISVFRAGCFKPRTDPYAWQGSGASGLKWLEEVREQYGMNIISEVSNYTNFHLVESAADIIQIGAKAMYDHSLLIGSGKSSKPVLVKRGFGATVKEYLRMVEYILSSGNEKVMLCERGIRTFETSTRFTYDLCGAAVMQETTRLPLILDPSHAAGDSRLVGKLALASAGFGCDGLIIEVHCSPEEALCDKAQALSPKEYKELYKRVKDIVALGGRKMV